MYIGYRGPSSDFLARQRQLSEMGEKWVQGIAARLFRESVNAEMKSRKFDRTRYYRGGCRGWRDFKHGRNFDNFGDGRGGLAV